MQVARCHALRSGLDRLARDLCFVAALLRDKAEFIACDAPYANRLTLGILAACAEDEGRRISERTRVALAQARQRGTRLGGYRGVPVSADGQEKGRAVQARAAREMASALEPMIAALRAQGIVTTPAIAAALNARGVATPRGGKWHPASISRVLHRLAA